MNARACMRVLLLQLLATGGARAQESIKLNPALPTGLGSALREHVGGTRSRSDRRTEGRRPQEATQDRPGSEPGGSPGTLQMGGTIAMLFVVAFLVVVVVLMLRARRDEEPADKRSSEIHERLADLLAVGDRLRAAGDHAGALRAYYLHALKLLRRLSGLEEGDYLADRSLLARIPYATVRQPFRQLSNLFQPIRYGAHPVPERGTDEAREAALEVREALRGELQGAGERS